MFIAIVIQSERELRFIAPGHELRCWSCKAQSIGLILTTGQFSIEIGAKAVLVLRGGY